MSKNGNERAGCGVGGVRDAARVQMARVRRVGCGARGVVCDYTRNMVFGCFINSVCVCEGWRASKNGNRLGRGGVRRAITRAT